MHGLHPVTSLNTSRYEKSCAVEQFHTVIPPGPTAARATPRQLSATWSDASQQWLSFTHPEGQLYHWCTRPGFSVVTEANLECPETNLQVSHWLKLVEDELEQRQIIPPQDLELFLELQEDSCNYYFVDHSSQSLFWLEHLSTEALDISPVASHAHLTHHITEWALERFYWVHVEFFPMHYDGRFTPKIIDDLFGVLSHGQADRHMDGYTLCYVARLSAAVANQRFMTFYGHENAQLDRLQEMLPNETPDHQWTFTIANGLLWGIPQGYCSQMEEVFLNEQVYVDHWTTFMSNCLREWTTSISWTFLVLIVSVLLSSGGSLITATPSILCCSAGIASASCLDLKLRPLKDASASSAARYLRTAKSPTLGFLPFAVVFSLPKASYMWGVAFLLAQIIHLTSQRLGKLSSLLAASSLALLVLFIFCVISTEELGDYEYVYIRSGDNRTFLPSACLGISVLAAAHSRIQLYGSLWGVPALGLPPPGEKTLHHSVAADESCSWRAPDLHVFNSGDICLHVEYITLTIH
ncbi:hypothetical protein F5I97DRAFT_1829450 [Phlebopus sp. FC_14]|nr:hypothetical protein F5I97DRAFT_1829450 [Phlebopus sp. FC_14]